MILETERLLLRPLAPDDLDALARMYADPETMRWIGDGSTATREETAAWLERHRALSERQGYGLYAAVERASGALVGRCGLVHWDDVGGAPELEVGWLIDRSRWGRGYATEAGRAWSDHAFGALGRARLVSLVHPGNGASIRVAEKLGMRHERDVAFRGRLTRLYARSV